MNVNCLVCKKHFHICKSHYKRGNGKYCSRKCFYISPFFKEKRRLDRIGKVTSPETRLKMSLNHPSGKNSHLWKGGLTNKRQVIYNSMEYKLWRTAVYERDKYKCVFCGSHKKLNADHIKPFSLFPELRFAIDNGRTLCVDCHKSTDTYSYKVFKYKREDFT